MPTTGELARLIYNGTRYVPDASAIPSGAAQAAETAAYGSMYDSSGATTVISIAGTYVKLGNTTTGDLNSLFTHASNKLTYTGVNTLVCHILVTLTCGYSGGAGNKNLSFRVAKNGTTVAQSQITRGLSATTDRGSVTFQCVLSLVTNDFIEIFATNDTDTNSVVVDRMYVLIDGMSDVTLVNKLRADLVTLGLIKGSA